MTIDRDRGISVRRFVIFALFVALNCFLGYSGQHIANEVGRFTARSGTKLPVFSMMSLSVPPWFHAVAAVALALAVLGASCKMAEHKLVYATVGILLVDIGAVFFLLWGVSVLFFGPPVIPPPT